MTEPESPIQPIAAPISRLRSRTCAVTTAESATCRIIRPRAASMAPGPVTPSNILLSRTRPGRLCPPANNCSNCGRGSTAALSSQPLLQLRPAAPGLLTADGNGQRLLLADQHHQPLAPGHRRVDQI